MFIVFLLFDWEGFASIVFSFIHTYMLLYNKLKCRFDGIFQIFNYMFFLIIVTLISDINIEQI